ncbi:MAG: cupin domain-containing protein [Rhodomicrobium sp.]
MAAAGNIFAGLPAPPFSGSEQTDELLTRPGVKIERIVSTGQASPPGFWHDQPWDEWAIVLSGAARLRFEGEADARPLGPGDYVFIPAHARHRVDWTSPDEATVWLAVHYSGSPRAL